jgi:hypothetical protein
MVRRYSGKILLFAVGPGHPHIGEFRASQAEMLFLGIHGQVARASLDDAGIPHLVACLHRDSSPDCIASRAFSRVSLELYLQPVPPALFGVIAKKRGRSVEVVDDDVEIAIPVEIKVGGAP